MFSHRWPHFCGGSEHTRATCGGDSKVSYPPAKFPYSAKFPIYPTEWLPHATRTIASVLAAERRTQPQKRSVCGGDGPQPVAHLSHKLQCVRQSLKIMVSYGNKCPRQKKRGHLWLNKVASVLGPLGCPHTESSFARSWQAGFGKHGNTLRARACLLQLLLSVCGLQCITVFTKPCLPASRITRTFTAIMHDVYTLANILAYKAIIIRYFLQN